MADRIHIPDNGISAASLATTCRRLSGDGRTATEVEAVALGPGAISLQPFEGAREISLGAGQFRVLGVENLGDRSYCCFSTDVGDLAIAVPAGTTVDHVTADTALKHYFKRDDLRFFGTDGKAV